jgi:UDP-3-O-[3-hydroxymyristoyl] glucosamine N-acyltransferase
MEFNAQQIAQLLEGTVEGNPKAIVRNVSKIEEGKPETLTFFANQKYEKYVYTTQASVVIVNNDFVPQQSVQATLIRVPDAYQALAKLLEMYEQMQPQKSGIEQPSFIHATASMGDFAYIGAFSYIGENVKLGTNVKVYPQVYIGDNVTIADNTYLVRRRKNLQKLSHWCQLCNPFGRNHRRRWLWLCSRRQQYL